MPTVRAHVVDAAWISAPSCCNIRPKATLLCTQTESYAEVAAPSPLTALGGPTARFVWPAVQVNFYGLKLALSSAPMLGTFNPDHRAVLTTNTSNVAVAAILTQSDDEGHQHPVAY